MADDTRVIEADGDEDADAMTGNDALENGDDPATEGPADPTSTEVR